MNESQQLPPPPTGSMPQFAVIDGEFSYHPYLAPAPMEFPKWPQLGRQRMFIRNELRHQGGIPVLEHLVFMNEVYRAMDAYNMLKRYVEINEFGDAAALRESPFPAYAVSPYRVFWTSPNWRFAVARPSGWHSYNDYKAIMRDHDMGTAGLGEV